MCLFINGSSGIEPLRKEMRVHSNWSPHPSHLPNYKSRPSRKKRFEGKRSNGLNVLLDLTLSLGDIHGAHHPYSAQEITLRKQLLPMLSTTMLVAVSLSGNAIGATPATDQPAQAVDHGFSQEDRAAFQDARVAALKAGLKLTAAQEKAWPAVEDAVRDLFKARADRAVELRDKWKDIRDKHDVIEGLQLRAQGLTARGAELSKLADAAKPLFNTLDEAQRRRFGVLLFHVLSNPHGGPGHSDWHDSR